MSRGVIRASARCSESKLPRGRLAGPESAFTDQLRLRSVIGPRKVEPQARKSESTRPLFRGPSQELPFSLQVSPRLKCRYSPDSVSPPSRIPLLTAEDRAEESTMTYQSSPAIHAQVPLAMCFNRPQPGEDRPHQ